MRTSQQFRFFLEGEYLKRFLFYFNVGRFRCLDFFYDALFKRAAIFTTPLNLMDFFFHDFKVVNSNGVCFFLKKAQCISGINFLENFLFKNIIFFSREFFCFCEIILALWKGGRLEECLNWCLDITYFRFVFIDFLIEWY